MRLGVQPDMRTKIGGTFLYETRFLISCLLLCFSSQGLESLAAIECENGTPFIVTHVNAYRSAEDEELLARELSHISNASVRDRVTEAFKGEVCAKDEPVLQEILRLMDSKEAAIRAETITILAFFPSQQVVVSTRKALGDNSARVRMMALAAVLAVCDVGAVPQVREIRRHDPAKNVRIYAKEVLGVLDGRGSKCRPLPKPS